MADEKTPGKASTRAKNKYNENYTFETPKEGDILDELKAIVEDMKEGNIDKLEVEREA